MQDKKSPNHDPTLPLLVTMLLLAMVGPPAWGAGPVVPEPASGAGGLLVTPKRVVFSARQRSAEIHLMNNGRKATTYRVELVEMVMDETGRLTLSDEATTSSLAGMVRFAPRQVTIAPGERQTVRLLLRKPAGLEPGEYRSHLRLRAIPEAAEPVVRQQELGEGGIGIRLVVLPAITLPIIVRHGPLAATVSLSELELETGEGAPRVSAWLVRAGERSVYGDLAAVFLPADGGAIPLAEARGIAIYAGVASRTVSLSLDPPDGVSLASGRLRLTFRSRPDADGGGEPLTAGAELALP